MRSLLFNFSGKRVLITGAGQGVGFQTTVDNNRSYRKISQKSLKSAFEFMRSLLFNFSGKRVLITGAGQGVGLQTTVDNSRSYRKISQKSLKSAN